MTFKLTLLLVILVLGNSAVVFTESDQLQNGNAKGSNLRTFAKPSFSVDSNDITPADALADPFGAGLSRGSNLRTFAKPSFSVDTSLITTADALADPFGAGLSRGSNLRTFAKPSFSVDTSNISPADALADPFGAGLSRGSKDSSSSTANLLASINTDEIDQFISLYQKLKAAGIFK